MAKDVESLAKSRDVRAAILHEFGCIPESILFHNRSVKAIDLRVDERSYSSTIRIDRTKMRGKLADVFDVSSQSCRGENGALSRFPQSVGKVLLLLYSKRGDTVLDPFAGHNSRMELCWRNHRHYIGCDVSASFMSANRTIRDMLFAERDADLFPDTNLSDISLIEGDSKRIPLEDGIGDFTITSPPYWDLEYYGDEPEQLGTGKSYESFLDGLFVVMRENYRLLKDGAFCVWCVNDFRKNGIFYLYHLHVVQLMQRAGFRCHDVVVTDLGPSIGSAFASQIIERKLLPKRHEFALIFRKGGGSLDKQVLFASREYAESLGTDIHEDDDSRLLDRCAVGLLNNSKGETHDKEESDNGSGAGSSGSEHSDAEAAQESRDERQAAS